MEEELPKKKEIKTPMQGRSVVWRDVKTTVSILH
jgi:hypothetical protein